MDRQEDYIAGLLRDGERIERRLRALEAREAISPAVMVQRVTSVEAQLATISKRVGTIAQSERDSILKAVAVVTREQIITRLDALVGRLDVLEAAGANRIAEHRGLLEALEVMAARIGKIELVAGALDQQPKQPKAARPRKARAKSRAPRTSPKSTKQRKRAV